MTTPLARSKAEVIKRPPRRKYHSIQGREGLWQSDVLFMRYAHSKEYLEENDGYTCALLVVETETRYAYCVPMRGKSEADVLAAFTKVFNDVTRAGRLFVELETDQGGEFLNAGMRAFLAENEVTHRVKAPGDHYSLGTIDSLSRSLKRFIEDFCEDEETIAWVPHLEEILREYNAHDVSIRRSQRGAPKSQKRGTLKASPDALVESQHESVEGGPLIRRARRFDRDRGAEGRAAADLLHAGDKVRVRLAPGEQPRDVSRLSKPGDLAKGREAWSHRVYTIQKRKGNSFWLLDSDGKAATRTYRAHELLKCASDSVDVPDLYEKAAAHDRREKRRIRERL